MKTIFTIIGLLSSINLYSQCIPSIIFSNTTTNSICTEVIGPVRYFYSNSLPDHNTGTFPNPGNPNIISAQQLSETMCAFPQMAASNTILDQGIGQCPFWEFGIGLNGLIFDPIANEYFENPNTGQLNTNWNLNALSPNVNLGLDFNDAHVQPTGKYHYHGFPDTLANAFGVAIGVHSPHIGFAADGYPVYGKYVYSNPNDSTSAIIEVASSYQLKSGTRPGNGITAPNGTYDGTYTQDYEYVSGLGDLDECNGRTGITPEYPNGTYYYVLTTDFPVIPRCLKGVPDNSFTIGPPPQGCNTSNASTICSVISVDELSDLASQILVFPNPADNILIINTNLEVNSIHVFDVSGKKVSGSNLPIAKLDISNFNSGTYYIQFNLDNSTVTKIFIKE